MKTVIEGVLEQAFGHGMDGQEYHLKLEGQVIIASNSGLFGFLKQKVGKKVTITIEE